MRTGLVYLTTRTGRAKWITRIKDVNAGWSGSSRSDTGQPVHLFLSSKLYKINFAEVFDLALSRQYEGKVDTWEIDQSNLQWYHYFLCGYRGMTEIVRERFHVPSKGYY